jgi:DNA excision repair protein ERCC-2
VVQAAGRVIRGPDERGIIVLFCERFTDPRYRDQLPAYWRAEALDTDDPVPVVSAFWARGG